MPRPGTKALHRRALLAGAVTAACNAPSLAALPGFPARAIRLIVAVVPGGPTDAIARIVAERLHARWGQPVIVENKAGASGAIAIDEVARAAPDGHTVLIGNVSTNAITVAAYPNRQRAAGLLGVTKLVEVPGILSANTALPVATVRELVAKMRSGELKDIRYGSPGLGTYPQIDMLRLLKKEGLVAKHVAYKGGGQILPALLGNEIQVDFLNEATALPLVKAGRLKALAVTWPERLPELAEVPTMQELGYGDIGTSAWHGMFVPGGTPPAVLAELHQATLAALDDPDAARRVAAQSMKLAPSPSPAAFTAFVAAEVAKWRTIIADNDIKVAAD